jgi:hypothetical protein
MAEPVLHQSDQTLTRVVGVFVRFVRCLNWSELSYNKTDLEHFESG